MSTVRIDQYESLNEFENFVNDKYVTIWLEAKIKSPFVSPSSILFLGELALKKKTNVISITFGEERPIFCLLLKKNGSTVKCLSSGFADHNFALVTDACNNQLCGNVLNEVFSLIKKSGWTLVWENFPAFSDLGRALDKTLVKQLVRIPYSVSPIRSEKDSDELFNAISNKKLKYYKRRIIKKGGQFEILKDDSDLEDWIQGFVKNHIDRWKETATPSKYNKPENVEILKNRMLAWIQDLVLIRFSVIMDEKRIAYCIGLQEGEHKLIYHAVTYDFDYFKYSPGKALILHIAEYMSEQKINTLDFGEGNEKYKLEFVNEMLPIEKLILTRQLISFDMLKAKLEKYIRTHDRLFSLIRKIRLRWMRR